MDFELWWLFGFALFFGLGWLAARIDIKQLLWESRQLPRSYFKGLNFLLNEQPDKAIEAFIEVVKVDPETVELHFALGSLFRRRGETERAIRMHRNLLERPDLGGEQRLHAMVELGQDYLKAGLLDRAEEMFLKLNSSPHRSEALRFLLEIYQLETDRTAEPGLSRARRAAPAREPSSARAHRGGAHAAARLPGELSFARPARCRLPVDTGLRRPRDRIQAGEGRVAPQSDLARLGQAARSAAPGRARRKAPRSGTRPQSHTQS